MTVVETTVTGNLTPDEVGLHEGLVLTGQFHLGKYKSLVVTVELVYLPGVTPVRRFDEVAGLVDDTWLAYLQKVASVGQRYLGVKLITCKTGQTAGSLDGKVTLVGTDAYTHGSPVATGNVALLYPRGIVGL